MSQNERGESEDGGVSRRKFGRFGVVALGALVGGSALVGVGTQSVRADAELEGADEFAANSASVTAHDGSVSAIAFGDPDDEDDSDRLTLSWEGINDPTYDDPDFTLAVRGVSEPADGDADAFSGDATSFEEVLAEADAVGIDETGGSEAYSWRDVFGENTANVLEHDYLDAADFAVTTDGETRVRELEVRIHVEWDAEESTTVTSEQKASATITVTNEEASVELGGRGSFEVDSDEEVAE